MEELRKRLEAGLRRFRRWLNTNAISRAIQGFLPTFIDGDASKLTVVVDDSLQPCTDGKTIWVSLLPGVLVEDTYTPEDWMICLRAATAHEAQHVNSSNFSDIEQIQNWYGQFMADNFGLEGTIGKGIAKEALNIVEDGRIEAIAIQRRPGMYIPFQFLNRIIRDGTRIEQRAEDPREEYHDFWGNVLSYAKTGLYSPGIKVYDGSEMESMFLYIRSFIDDGVSARTSKDCRLIVEEILTEIAPYLANLIQNSPELEEELKEKEQEKAEYSSNKESEFNGLPAGGGSGSGKNGNPLRAPSPTASGANAKSADANGSPNNGSQKSSMGFCNSQESAPPLNDTQLEEVRKLMSQEMTVANSADAAAKQSPTDDGLDKKAIEDIRASYTGQTTPFKAYPLKIDGTKPLPPEMKAQAMTLRREISRILTEKRKAQKGLRRGTLDTGSLWKQGIGDDSLFSRKGDPQAGSCAFYLLVDNSGSMSGGVSGGSKNNSTKSSAARSAAAIVEQAAISLVPCKIALFNQQGSSVNHMTVRTFDERSSKNFSWNSLTSIGPGGCNCDSMNIRVAAEELSRRREQKKVLFVLSDGEPSAYSSRASAMAEVREAVKFARRKGIIVISIMFGDEEFLKSSYDNYLAMYERNIVACQPKEITTKLAQLFRLIISR